MSEGKKIFLKPQDGLERVIALLGKAGKGARLVLHIPGDSVLAESLDNFHAVKREADAQGVYVVVTSTDRHLEELAYAAKLGARNSIFGRNERMVVDIIKRIPKSEPRTARDGARAERPLLTTPVSLPRRPEKKERHERSKLPATKFNVRWVAIALGVLLLAGGVGAVGSTYFPRATIVLHLVKTPVTFSNPVTVRTDVSVYSVDGTNIILPGERFTSTKNVTETFPATGSSTDSGKASGSIYIYNERSSAQTLIASTRFVSPKGLTYRIPSRVTVPAEASGVPGKVEATIVADQPGESYNYTPSSGERWTIPGFKDYGLTDQYQKIYGVPAGALTGGTSGAHVVATDADITAAKGQVTTILRDAVAQEMQVTSGGGLVSPDGAQTFTLTQFNVDQTVSKDDTFSVFAEGTLTEIAFKESDLETAVLAAVKSPVDYDVTMSDPKFSFSTSTLENGTLRFTVTGSFTALPKLDVASVERQLMGQSEASVKTTLLSVPGLKSAQVNLWPSFFKDIPNDAKKIVVQIGS